VTYTALTFTHPAVCRPTAEVCLLYNARLQSSDVNKDWTHKDQDKDKDKDQSHKDKDKD